MFNHRFYPYIIVLSISVLLAVSYVSYRAYQKHVDYDRFISKAQAFTGEHTHGEAEISHSHLSTDGQPASSAENGSLANLWFKGSAVQNRYSGVDKHKMFMEWIDTGTKNDLIEAYVKESQANNPFRGKVIQRVVSPQGQIHTVLVPEGYEYQEGDSILRSELDPATQVFSFGGDPMTLTVGGIEHEVPGYHSIEDPYEREEYFNKFQWSIINGVSMDEVEQKVEAGELDFSLSEEMIRYVDRKEEQQQRAQWLSDQFPKPLPPDRPPVKVSFLRDEGEDGLPGGMRKLKGSLPSGSSEAVSDGDSLAIDPFSEGSIKADASGAPVRSDVPVSPSDLPDMVEPQLPPSVADIETQLTPQGIENELTEGLSLERFDKAQQLIDQYGTEEGLRRLRASDPEAARRFESVPRLRREQPPTRDTSNDAASTQ